MRQHILHSLQTWRRSLSQVRSCGSPRPKQERIDLYGVTFMTSSHKGKGSLSVPSQDRPRESRERSCVLPEKISTVKKRSAISLTTSSKGQRKELLKIHWKLLRYLLILNESSKIYEETPWWAPQRGVKRFLLPRLGHRLLKMRRVVNSLCHFTLTWRQNSLSQSKRKKPLKVRSSQRDWIVSIWTLLRQDPLHCWVSQRRWGRICYDHRERAEHMNTVHRLKPDTQR